MMFASFLDSFPGMRRRFVAQVYRANHHGIIHADLSAG
jgi:hypothetical protein